MSPTDNDMDNSYESPSSTATSSPAASGATKYERRHFAYVVAVVLAGSFLLTLLTAPRFSMSPYAAMLFFSAVAAGPFSAMYHTSWIFASSEIIVCFLVFTATFLYLIAPRKATFVVSILGAIAWVLLGAFLILLLA